MKKKKISLLILTLALTASLLAACGGTGNDGKNKITTDGIRAESSTNGLGTDGSTKRAEPTGTTERRMDSTTIESASDGLNHSVDGSTRVDAVNPTKRTDNNGIVGDIVTDIATDLDIHNTTSVDGTR